MQKVLACIMCVLLCAQWSYAQPSVSFGSEDFDGGSDTVTLPSERISSANITLELKGVDILDVLKVLSKKSGLNIVAGKNVRGQVTLFLQDVDVWDALKIILETSDLAYEQKGDIIKVITKSDYEALYGKPYADKKEKKHVYLAHAKAQPVSDLLNQLKSSVGKIIVEEATNSLILIDTPEALEEMLSAINNVDVPMQTRIFPLKYANAEDVEAKITELITANVGTLKVDLRTNKVIVTDIPAKLDQIGKIVAEFDSKPRQVLIEARIIEVALEDEYVLGVDWDLLFNRTQVSPITYESNTLGGTNIPNTSGPLGGVTNSNLAVFTINATTDEFNAVITALEGMGKTNTLSNPRVAVLNNEEATIAVATRQPFVSQTVVQGDTTSTTADNVEFVDVGVTLSVTPTITEDSYILMEVKPEVSTAGDPLTLTSTDAQGEQFTRTVVPVVTSQEVETKVLVKSGTTTILGGLIQDSQSVTVRKVPVLGDIPWVGAAFRTKADDFRKTELVIFITPYIISGDIPTEDIDRFYDSEDRPLGFDELGGPRYEFTETSQKSQPYLQVDEEPFWEEHFQLGPKHFKKRSDQFELDRAMAVREAMDTLSGDRKQIRDVVPMDASSSEYYGLVKKQVFDAIVDDPSLVTLKGEVKIKMIIAKNGYLKRIDTRSITDPGKNNALILAINKYAPYPTFPADFEADEVEVNFSLFF